MVLKHAGKEVINLPGYIQDVMDSERQRDMNERKDETQMREGCVFSGVNLSTLKKIFNI